MAIPKKTKRAIERIKNRRPPSAYVKKALRGGRPKKKVKGKSNSGVKTGHLKGAGARVIKKINSSRCDWVHNQESIQSAYVEILKKTGRVPTATAIAEKTGFGSDTVGKHLKKFDFSRVRKRMGISLNLALARATENATIKGASFKDIELLFKIGGELVEKVEHAGRIDYRSYGEKLNGSDGGGTTDFERAKRLSQLLISENLI